MELIDKEKVVAEIEKITEEPAPSHDSQCPWEDGYYCGLYKAESIIDSFEVKEDAFIDKACEWLKFNYAEFTDNTRLGIKIDELIKDFKQAMEE